MLWILPAQRTAPMDAVPDLWAFKTSVRVAHATSDVCGSESHDATDATHLPTDVVTVAITHSVAHSFALTVAHQRTHARAIHIADAQTDVPTFVTAHAQTIDAAERNTHFAHASAICDAHDESDFATDAASDREPHSVSDSAAHIDADLTHRRTLAPPHEPLSRSLLRAVAASHAFAHSVAIAPSVAHSELESIARTLEITIEVPVALTEFESVAHTFQITDAHSDDAALAHSDLAIAFALQKSFAFAVDKSERIADQITDVDADTESDDARNDFLFARDGQNLSLRGRPSVCDPMRYAQCVLGCAPALSALLRLSRRVCRIPFVSARTHWRSQRRRLCAFL